MRKLLERYSICIQMLVGNKERQAPKLSPLNTWLSVPLRHQATCRHFPKIGWQTNWCPNLGQSSPAGPQPGSSSCARSESGAWPSSGQNKEDMSWAEWTMEAERHRWVEIQLGSDHQTLKQKTCWTYRPRIPVERNCLVPEKAFWPLRFLYVFADFTP